VAVPAGARIGVVVPCYNDGAFIDEALASIREAEVVPVTVVDDGSTDPGTVDVLRRLETRPGVQVVHHDRNRGLAAARNTGTAATATPLLFFLDSDDHLEPGALARLAAALEQDPGAAFAFGAVRFFGSAQGVRETRPWSPWHVLYNNFWSASSLFRRDALLAAGGFDTRSAWEDWDFFLKAAGLGLRGVRVDGVAFAYRIHPTVRLRATGQRRFRQEYRGLRALHAPLYARRRELRRAARPSRVERVFWPAVGFAYAQLPSALVRALVAAKNGVQLRAAPRPSG
jgi:glycosyltransferase involved in cell wall biosynthesis